MILQNKTAIIYGAGGSMGRTVAMALADAGAGVFLAGRNIGPVQKVADEITGAGGKAEACLVDAFDEQAVTANLNEVVKKAGAIDISFCAIGLDVVQNKPLTDISTADFVRPVTQAMQSQFITGVAAAKQMMKQRSGVILSLTATPGGIGYPQTGGFAPACCAIESFSRNLASELGIYGIRVVNIRSAGSPDSAVFADALASGPEIAGAIVRQMEADTMLKKLPPMAYIANAAVFLVSDLAAGITGVTVDVTCGTTAGLNYKVGGAVVS